MPENNSIETLNAETILALMESLQDGVTPADMAGIDEDQLETMYALAYQLYQSSQYQDAETLFKGLCCYDYNQVRFWFGLAACLQANGRFQQAVDAYSMAAVTGGFKDPTPIYHAAICFLKMGDHQSALDALRNLETLVEDDDGARQEHQAVLSRARDLASAIAES